MDILRNIRHFAGKHVVIILTRECNLSCSYCNVIRQDYKDVTAEEWKREIDLFDRFNVKNITVMGGEPTEHPDLPGILRYMRENTSATVSLVSNGIKIREDPSFRKKLSALDLDVLVVSLNTEKELSLLPLYASNFSSVIVNTIVSSGNIGEIPSMIQRISKYVNCFFDPMIMQVDENTFSKRANERLLPGRKDVDELSEKLRRMKLYGCPIISTFQYLGRMGDYVSGWRWNCGKNAFNRFFALNNDARIMVCQGTHPLDFRLSDLADGARMDEFKEKVDDIVSGCGGCLYNCTFNSSVNRISKLLGFAPMAPRVLRKFASGG